MATTENTEAHGKKQSCDEVCSARLQTDTDVVHSSKSFHAFPSVAFRPINASFLVGLRKFFCFQVAFIAPREVSR